MERKLLCGREKEQENKRMIMNRWRKMGEEEEEEWGREEYRSRH